MAGAVCKTCAETVEDVADGDWPSTCPSHTVEHDSGDRLLVGIVTESMDLVRSCRDDITGITCGNEPEEASFGGVLRLPPAEDYSAESPCLTSRSAQGSHKPMQLGRVVGKPALRHGRELAEHGSHDDLDMIMPRRLRDLTVARLEALQQKKQADWVAKKVCNVVVLELPMAPADEGPQALGSHHKTPPWTSPSKREQCEGQGDQRDAGMPAREQADASCADTLDAGRAVIQGSDCAAVAWRGRHRGPRRSECEVVCMLFARMILFKLLGRDCTPS